MKPTSPDSEIYFRTLFSLISNLEITDRKKDGISLDDAVETVVKCISSLRLRSGKVILIGNGGSAAIASHMQNDLCAAVGVKAMVFQDASLTTALSNDHGYDSAFEKQTDLWAQRQDCLIAISSSGQSENILRAVTIARVRGCQVITLSGFDKRNSLRKAGDLNFYVPARGYGLVELAHSILTHYITDYASFGQDPDRLRRRQPITVEHDFLASQSNGNGKSPTRRLEVTDELEINKDSLR